LKRGEVIGDRFEVRTVAGSGAMGVVWRGRDRVTGKDVAVKILRAGGELERFARESRLLAELDHPGIVRYVAHGQCDEGPYLVMEWLEGESLGERLGRQELGMRASVALVTRLASAIGAAHRRQIVHRDLKPSNVFLVDRRLDDIRVLDFGVARHGALASDLTHTGMVIGSPRYMAPEQARGDRDVGPTADVWALGAILFRCLTGRALFADGPMELVISDLLLSPVPRVSDVLENVPPELDAVVAWLLGKEPTLRPKDGVAVSNALAALSLPEDREAPEAGSPEKHALTLLEERFTCLVVLDAPEPWPAELEASVKDLARRRGGSTERHGRMLSVVLSTRGTASDLCASAARCALAIHELAPELPIVLATGSGHSTESSRPDRSVVARATALFGALTPGIRVDPRAVGLLESRFELGRGSGEHVMLLAERAEALPVRRLLGRATPCVGREREIATLESLLAESMGDGVARAALVTGPPGIGKSRLRYELLRRIPGIVTDLGLPGAAVWLGRADPVAAGSPFGLLGSALESGLGLSTADGLRERVARRVPAADVERISECLRALVGGSADAGSRDPTVADPVRVGDRLRAGWEDFLDAELAAEPLVLVLEDLEWGDWPSLRFIDAALRVHRDRPLAVVALGRPEVTDAFPGLWAERGVLHLPLSELSKRASARLVRSVLGDRLSDEDVALVCEKAAGNAFFLEELIRAMAESPDAALPESVLVMAQARILGVEPEARQLLRAASVFGPVFWKRGVVALLDGARSEPEVTEWLERLVRRELVSPRKVSRFEGEDELTFRHALVREAAYSMLTDEDRRLGHRLAAGWLEAAGERDALRLAQHWALGDEPARAGPSYRRAAEHAVEGNDFTAALAHAERALAAGVPDEMRGDVHLLRAVAHHWRGEAPECEIAARDARDASAPRSKRWYVAAGQAARVASRLGRHAELDALLEELESDTEPATAGTRAVVAAQLGVAALRAGKSSSAERLLSRVQRELGTLADDDHDAHAWVARLEGYAALVRGDAATYLRQTERAVACFERAGDVRNALTFQTSVGFANIALGRYAAAEDALRDALAGAERMNLAVTAAIARHNLGYAVAMLGRLDEGIELERQAVHDSHAQGDRWIEAVSETYHAVLALRAGDPAEAAAAASRAAQLSDRPNRALATALLARAELALGERRAARASATSAFELLQELGGIEDGDALVRLVHAEALVASGEHAEAATAIREAATHLRRRADAISDAELRQSFLENVPEHAETLALERELSPE
jgi:tetratricopeptide (TPR) repeat protein